MNSTLLAGVDDDNNKENTSIAGVQNQGAELDTESDHNSIDPNKDNDNSSKASANLNRSQISVHSAKKKHQNIS